MTAEEDERGREAGGSAARRAEKQTIRAASGCLWSHKRQTDGC